MKIQDLQSILNLPINGCFTFGFPNLWSLLQAFPDIFVSTSAKPINFRGEVKLNTQCIREYQHAIYRKIHKSQLKTFSFVVTVTTGGFISYMQYSCDENNSAGAANGNSFGIDETTDANHNNSGGYSDGRSSMLSSSGTSDSSAMQMSTYIDPIELNNHPVYEMASKNSYHDTVTDMENQTKLETSNRAFEMHHFDVASSESRMDGECENIQIFIILPI